LPKGIRKSEEAVAETIENNVRRLIIDETPVDPAYYEKMSKLLDALIEQRRKGVINYKEYLAQIARLTREATIPGGGPGGYPASVRTAAQRELFNNLEKNEDLTLAVDAAIQGCRQDGWKDNPIKTKRVRNAIKAVLEKTSVKDTPPEGFTIREDGSNAYAVDSQTTRILDLARHQPKGAGGRLGHPEDENQVGGLQPVGSPRLVQPGAGQEA
jgi:type I restriction enzyme R subunit